MKKKQFFFSNLVNMGFDKNLFYKKIGTLSLGQRMRIKLVQIIINNYNLLLLDEPTNHLDLSNKIELERALINFPGSIIIASHDRYLLSKAINKVFVFENTGIKRLEDSYTEYIQKSKNKTNEKEKKFYSTMTDEEKMRFIEEEMANPNKSEEEIEKLLEIYYEFQKSEFGSKKTSEIISNK